MSKSPSLRRIQADIRELALDPSDRYYAAPMENDMFEWHFTIRGADDTDFAGGIYHGRILLPPEYPFKPPNIVFLTPSGRFETHTKVCLSFSAFHPELWQPAWGIRLILEALISFLPTPADGAIGALDWSKQERQNLAKKSVDFCCPVCGPVKNLLPKLGSTSGTTTSRFAKEIQELQRLQEIAEGKNKKAKAAILTDNSEEQGSEKDNNNIDAKENAGTNGTLEASSSQSPADAPADSTSQLGSDIAPAGVDYEERTSTTSDQPAATLVTSSSPHRIAEQSAVGSTDALRSAPTASAESQPASVSTTASAANSHDATEAVGTMEANGDADVNTNILDQSVEESADQNIPIETDPAWMMDPLLHLMIGLLAVICYMLLQKWNALYAELLHLRAMNQQQA